MTNPAHLPYDELDMSYYVHPDQMDAMIYAQELQTYESPYQTPLTDFFYDSKQQHFLAGADVDGYQPNAMAHHAAYNQYAVYRHSNTPQHDQFCRQSSPDGTDLSSTSGSPWMSVHPDTHPTHLGPFDRPEFIDTDSPCWDTASHLGSFMGTYFPPDCGSGALYKAEDFSEETYVSTTTILPNVGRLSQWPVSTLEEESADEATSPRTPETPAPKSEDDDLDYKPTGTRFGRKASSHTARHNHSSSKVKKNGRHDRHNERRGRTRHIESMLDHGTHTSSADGDVRPGFSCPLTPYGCTSQFKSKNEWKRHVLSQHLAIGYYCCSLCDENKEPNIFNRKDLFTAHLERMHFKDEKPLKITDETSMHQSQPNKSIRRSPKGNHKLGLLKGARKEGKAEKRKRDPALEEKLDSMREECWQKLRDPPTRTACVFCHEEFTGPESHETWLEHVGRHLTNNAKGVESCNGRRLTQEPDWSEDTLFATWLLQVGLLQQTFSDETGEIQLTLTDRSSADSATIGRLSKNASAQDEDVDAEGEEDDNEERR